jgi:type IV secretion system protein VirB10
MSGQQSVVENGKSSVAGSGGSAMSVGTKIGIGALFGLLALGFVWFPAALSQKHSGAQKPAAGNYSSGGEQFIPAPQTTPQAPAVNASNASRTLPTPQAQPTLSFGDQSQSSPASAPIMAYSGSAGVSIQPQPAAPASAASNNVIPVSDDTGSQGQSDQDKSPLAQKLQPTVLDGEKATLLPNPDLTITEGTMIPCILQTAINSELPSLVTCVVPIDVRGTTGNVVLLDRGTKIVGQLESGLMQGQNRVFVDWTRAETPDHVLVTLDSPGTDELGESGLPGAVDNHFWQRFGGALMLTLVQGGLNAATTVAAGQGGADSTSQQAAVGFLYSGQNNAQTIANTALQNTINIPPTLTKNQGDTVSLIVAHDLDFSSVYQLQVEGTENGNGG